jgi:Flp pilus assembly protein TadG
MVRIMYLKREEGAAAVEFALLLPLLMLILFGIIEFGLILYNQEVITNASREGARFGIVIGSPRPDDTLIRGVVTSYLTNAGLTVCDASCVQVTGAQGASGSDLTVSLTYPYTFLLVPNFAAYFTVSLSDTLNLSATTLMKLE